MANYKGLDLTDRVFDPYKPIENVMKPWGCYKVWMRGKQDGNEYWVKTLHFSKGHSLSLQSHDFRTEEWKVLKGKGIIQVNNTYQGVQEGWSGIIQPKDLHRIWNTNSEELIVFEYAYGQLSESDLTRWADQYGRT